MRRKWLVLIICLIMVLLSGALHAQEGAFVEGFDDPALPGWEHTPNVLAVDGTLTVPAPGFVAHGGNWGDFRLTVDAQRSGEGELVFTYRVHEGGANIVVLGATFVLLQREQAGQVVELASAHELEIPAHDWFSLAISASGGTHAITLNDEPILQAEERGALLPPGAVGFEALGTAVGRYDNLVIRPDTFEADNVPTPPEASVPPSTDLTWVRTGGPPGGLGYDIRYSFADHNQWYVTDAWAGIHMSTDRGLTWFPSNQGIPTRFGPVGDVIPVFSATVDPHDPNIVWIGMQNVGAIMKSIDGGHTWQEMDNGVDRTLMPLSFRGITVDPRSSDIVYAMAEIGSIGWTADHTERRGLEQDMTKGIVYRTTDGGQNWIEIWRGDNLARYAWINPNDPNIIYISTGIFDREAANTDVEAGFAGGVGILKSTDGGATWQTLGQDNGLLDLYVGSLFMNSEDPNVLLAAAAQNNWSGYSGDYTGGVYLTEDGGRTWDRVLVGELFGSVEFCPSDSKIAYAASPEAVYRSDDLGHTWQRFSRADNTWGSSGVVAGFPIDIQCDPDDSMRVFINNYLGGNFLSTDGGQSWVSASHGYTGALVHHLEVAPGQPQTVYAASRTGVFRSDDGGQTWNGLAYPPEGLPVKLNEITALAVSPVSADHVLTAPADAATALYSSDGGHTWLHSPLPNTSGSPNSIVFAPSDPSIVYASTGDVACATMPASTMMHSICERSGMGVYVSSDGGRTWTPTTGMMNTNVVTLAVDPQDPNVIYASTIDGKVMKSNDGGQSWNPANAGLLSELVLNLTIDPNNPAILFAGIDGGGVYRSMDGGRSWTQSAAGMDPNAVVRSVVVDPTDSQTVYAADSMSGVYRSTDGGATWRPLNNGLTHLTASVLSIADDGSVLYLGVEGDGVQRLDLR